MRPAELSTPGGIPGVRTPAIRDQPSPQALTQELPGHLTTARPPHDTHGDPGRDRRPQPGTLPPFAPSRVVQVRRRLLWDRAPCFRHGLGHRLRGRRLQARERAQTDRHAQEIFHEALCGALGQMRGARAPRGDGLHPWAQRPAGNAHRPCGARGLPTHWADQPMPLILGDDRLHGWDLGDLMPLGLAIFSRPGVLTAGAALGLDGDDHLHPLDRDQRAGVPLVAGLPAGPTPTGLVPWPPAEGLGRIARRRPRRGARVVLQPLGSVLDRRFQALDDGLQHRHPGFEGPNVVLDRSWGLVPQLLGERTLGHHGPRCDATSASAGKYFSFRPGERFQEESVSIVMLGPGTVEVKGGLSGLLSCCSISQVGAYF